MRCPDSCLCHAVQRARAIAAESLPLRPDPDLIDNVEGDRRAVARTRARAVSLRDLGRVSGHPDPDPSTCRCTEVGELRAAIARVEALLDASAGPASLLAVRRVREALSGPGACICPPDYCLGTDSDSGMRVECAACLALDPELPCLAETSTP